LEVLGRVATCCGSGKALDVAPYGVPTVREEGALSLVAAFDLAAFPGFVATMSAGLAWISGLDIEATWAARLGTLLLFRIVGGL
jgi:hypothetical protein